MATTNKFYEIAEAVAGKDASDALYLKVLEAVTRGYNLRAIEDLEAE